MGVLFITLSLDILTNLSVISGFDSYRFSHFRAAAPLTEHVGKHPLHVLSLLTLHFNLEVTWSERPVQLRMMDTLNSAEITFLLKCVSAEVLNGTF